MPTKYQHQKNPNLNCKMSLDNLKINQRNYYNLPKSVF